MRHLGAVSLEPGEIIRAGDEKVAVIRLWLFLKTHKDTHEVNTESSSVTSLELPRDTGKTEGVEEGIPIGWRRTWNRRDGSSRDTVK